MLKITVKEALRLAGHCGTIEATLARNIAQAYLGDYPSMAGFEYGICFYAGMVAGVRRERARRRRRQSGQGA